MRVGDSRDEPNFPSKRKLLSYQIKMEKMFNKSNGTKKRKYNANIHKSMIIPDGVFQTNTELFVTVNTKTHVNFNLLVIYGYHFLLIHLLMDLVPMK